MISDGSMIFAYKTSPGSAFSPAVRQSLATTLVWLVVINIFALLVLNRLNLAPDNAFSWLSLISGNTVQQNWNLVDLHKRWDSYWYLDIAQNGYSLRGEQDIANVVFFPLYPLLLRLTSLLTAGNLVLAGWLLSSLCLLGAVALLTRLSEEFHQDVDPSLPVVFLLVHPAAFFLNAVYTESLFLLLSLATVLWARRNQFLIAAVCAALASATRIAGLFLCVVLLVEFLRNNGWRALLTRRVLPLAIAPLGTLAFCTYHWIAFDDFFLYLKVQDNFGRDFSFNIDDPFFSNSALANTILDFSHTGLAIVLTLITLWRVRLSYGIYMLISLIVPLSTGSTLAIGRYSMVLFPMYLIAASIRSPVGRGAWLFSSTLLLALDITRFVHHYWTN